MSTSRGLGRYHYMKKVTPAWANAAAMKRIYDRAALLNKEVDHIVPLNSPIVCGLHCEDNMQVLTSLENSAKSNRWWPDMPNENLDLFGIAECEQYNLF